MNNSHLKKRKYIITKCGVFSMLVILMSGLLISCTNRTAVKDPEQTTSIVSSEETAAVVPSESTEATEVMTIDTQVCPLTFPLSYSDNMKHAEVIQDNVVMEVFYLVYEETQMELFRIQFDPQETDHDMGVMKTDSGDLYITVSVCDYPEDALENQDVRELYQSMMGCVDTVLTSIQNDSRFSKKENVQIRVYDNDLRYWSISLPENMEWEETAGEENYRVTFYGNIKDIKIKLYEVAIGGSELSSSLGYYKIDGSYKPVSIGSFDLPATDGWSEGEITELFTMMETINAVIQTIASDANYAADMPE